MINERRLTPMRALELLREVDRRAAICRELNQNAAASVLERVGNQLADHIRAGLASKRRRRKAS